jgi:hypothetical protein
MGATTEAVRTIDSLHGSRILAAIKDSGVELVQSVPDIVTSAGLLRPIAQDRQLRLIRVCKEDACVGIAAGLAFCSKRVDSDPALGPARFDLRHSRRRDRIRPADLPDGRPAQARGQTAAAAVEALWRAHRRAEFSTPCASPITLIETDAEAAKIRPAIDDAYRQS